MELKKLPKRATLLTTSLTTAILTTATLTTALTTPPPREQIELSQITGDGVITDITWTQIVISANDDYHGVVAIDDVATPIIVDEDTQSAVSHLSIISPPPSSV